MVDSLAVYDRLLCRVTDTDVGKRQAFSFMPKGIENMFSFPCFYCIRILYISSLLLWNLCPLTYLQQHPIPWQSFAALLSASSECLASHTSLMHQRVIIVSFNVLPMSCQCLANVLPMSCQCLANVLPMSCQSCQCLANVLPMSCQCLANVLPMSCQCLANVLPMSCQCFANVLYCIVLYCIMRPYTDGQLDRYHIGISRELSEIRT